ncbi:hypothetical protein NM208_g6580 [Fusarium decemcellulare]|uniref:Uncharacterized protein n=1 Tax=Fusarium decemcellulare TaxID=57161 RepID=A0ACC1SCF6_9HYPO|nr:hypothetical protein NM208_g6580 [Fusarium decemcellulare]
MGLSFDEEPQALAKVLSKLNMTSRVGWLQRGVPPTDCESVGDRSAGVIALVRSIAAKRPDVSQPSGFSTCLELVNDCTLSRLTVTRCATWQCHDYAEVYTGDITPHDGVLPEEKQSGEDDAYSRFYEIHPKRRHRIRELCVEYRQNRTPQALLTKSADKYQRLEKAWEYQRQYPELDFSEFRRDQALVHDLKTISNNIS